MAIDSNKVFSNFLNTDDDFFFSLVTDEVKPDDYKESSSLPPLFDFEESEQAMTNIKEQEYFRFMFCDEKMEPVAGEKRKIEKMQTSAVTLCSRLQCIKILHQILDCPVPNK